MIPALEIVNLRLEWGRTDSSIVACERGGSSFGDRRRVVSSGLKGGYISAVPSHGSSFEKEQLHLDRSRLEFPNALRAYCCWRVRYAALALIWSAVWLMAEIGTAHRWKREITMQEKRVALVTGANQGVGLQVAKDLVANGFTVLVGSRTFERGEAAAE